MPITHLWVGYPVNLWFADSSNPWSTSGLLTAVEGMGNLPRTGGKLFPCTVAQATYTTRAIIESAISESFAIILVLTPPVETIRGYCLYILVRNEVLVEILRKFSRIQSWFIAMCRVQKPVKPPKFFPWLLSLWNEGGDVPDLSPSNRQYICWNTYKKYM